MEQLNEILEKVWLPQTAMLPRRHHTTMRLRDAFKHQTDTDTLALSNPLPSLPHPRLRAYHLRPEVNEPVPP